MAGLYLGSDELFKACLGSDEVEVYLGDELLWPQVREFKAILTLTGGTTVEIPDNGSSELTQAEVTGAVGSNNSAITEVVISSAVTSIGNSAFYNQRVLTSITIPDSVTSLGTSVFRSGTSLVNVTIPSGVTSIPTNTFASCLALTALTLSSGITSIGSNAFQQCPSLTSLTIEATTPPTINSTTFRYSDSVVFYVPCDSVSAYTAATDWSTYSSRIQGYGCPKAILYVNQTSYSIPDDGNTTLTSGEVRTALSNYTAITRAEIYDSVTSIGENAFISCKKLTSVTIPDSVTVIGNGSFNNCQKLRSVSIPSGVTSIGQKAFQSCPLSGGLTIPSAVTTINDYSFHGCSGLTSVTMHDGITSIGDSAFGCLTLTSLTLPSGVTSIGAHAFQYCSGLTSIVIPSGVTSISNSCFLGCSGLTSVTIPNSVTSIGSGAFELCISLLEFTIPSGVTSISRCCFNACHAMSSITIPDSVTGIGYTSFQSCYSLTSLTIPSAVTSIDKFAFALVSGTTNGIKFESTTPPTLANVNAFTNTNNCPIFVPCGTLTAYTAATNWSSLSSRMQEYGCSDGPSATIHLKYWSDDGCEGEGCDIEDDRYIYGEITRAAVESAITDHDYAEDMDVVRWGDVVYIEVASGVTSIGAEAFNFADDPMDGWKILYVKFLGTTPPTIGTHAFGGGHEFDSMRYYILAPSAATTAYTNAFSAQSADFEGVYPSDVPCMAAVTSSWEGDPPPTSTTYVYGPATLINLAKNLGVWNDELGVVSWGDFGGQIEEVRIGSATTSIAADAFNNTADHVNCEEGVFKWVIDTDTVTSLGVDSFGWLNMKEVWLSGSTNVLHLDAMDHASFKALCTCNQYDEEQDDYVDVDTWFNYKIYVDDTLLSAYQADSKWSAYGNRVKGESDWEEPEIDWCNHIDDEEPPIEP